jgi:heme exporter protein C
VTKLGAPSIAISMLVPLLIMTLAYMCYFAAVLLIRVRGDILEQEGNSSWVRELVSGAVD